MNTENQNQNIQSIMNDTLELNVKINGTLRQQITYFFSILLFSLIFSYSLQKFTYFSLVPTEMGVSPAVLTLPNICEIIMLLLIQNYRRYPKKCPTLLICSRRSTNIRDLQVTQKPFLPEFCNGNVGLIQSHNVWNRQK